jgi:hypothetical protein
MACYIVHPDNPGGTAGLRYRYPIFSISGILFELPYCKTLTVGHPTLGKVSVGIRAYDYRDDWGDPCEGFQIRSPTEVENEDDFIDMVKESIPLRSVAKVKAWDEFSADPARFAEGQLIANAIGIGELYSDVVSDRIRNPTKAREGPLSSQDFKDPETVTEVKRPRSKLFDPEPEEEETQVANWVSASAVAIKGKGMEPPKVSFREPIVNDDGSSEFVKKRIQKAAIKSELKVLAKLRPIGIGEEPHAIIEPQKTVVDDPSVELESKTQSVTLGLEEDPDGASDGGETVFSLPDSVFSKQSKSTAYTVLSSWAHDPGPGARLDSRPYPFERTGWEQEGYPLLATGEAKLSGTGAGYPAKEKALVPRVVKGNG